MNLWFWTIFVYGGGLLGFQPVNHQRLSPILPIYGWNGGIDIVK
jgi:hypothetical protein